MKALLQMEAERQLRAERKRDPAGFAREIEEYRTVVRRCLDEVSLREVAREIGMSPTGLRKFRDGTDPYGPTVLKLREWMQRRAGTDAARPSS